MQGRWKPLEGLEQRTLTPSAVLRGPVGGQKEDTVRGWYSDTGLQCLLDSTCSGKLSLGPDHLLPDSGCSCHRGHHVNVLVAQSCLTLCSLMDCSPPDPSADGILQATLEWVAIPFSQGSNPGLLHCRQILYHLSTIKCLNCLFTCSKFPLDCKTLWGQKPWLS